MIRGHLSYTAIPTTLTDVTHGRDQNRSGLRLEAYSRPKRDEHDVSPV